MEKSKIRCAVNEVRYMEFIHITLHVGLPQAVKITLIQCTVVPSYTVREQLQNSNEQVDHECVGMRFVKDRIVF